MQVQKFEKSSVGSTQKKEGDPSYGSRNTRATQERLELYAINHLSEVHF